MGRPERTAPPRHPGQQPQPADRSAQRARQVSSSCPSPYDRPPTLPQPPRAPADEPLEEGQCLAVFVDAGTVGFADAEAVAAGMPEGNWYEELFDNGTDRSWFSLMDSGTHLIEGCANIVMPAATAGENVVLAHSGWGDGAYPVLEAG
ncbi:DUF4241 domain-containing protein [Kribbella sp. NPDC051620]|uniref:DUF4241 domain-containing protein n=1 Tax=Kribbella sp. NPDC051620 TaxID=3364120 RepID=UPI0037873CBF